MALRPTSWCTWGNARQPNSFSSETKAPQGNRTHGGKAYSSAPFCLLVQRMLRIRVAEGAGARDNLVHVRGAHAA